MIFFMIFHDISCWFCYVLITMIMAFTLVVMNWTNCMVLVIMTAMLIDAYGYVHSRNDGCDVGSLYSL